MLFGFFVIINDKYERIVVLVESTVRFGEVHSSRLTVHGKEVHSPRFSY
jgi:hypothetical protein